MNWWEWVFSGIGVLGLGLLIEWLRRRSRSSGQQATITAQSAKVTDSPVASGTGITQNVNSPTFNLSLPAVAPGSPGSERYNEWRELIDEIHESIVRMGYAFMPLVPVKTGDDRNDYQAGIRRGNRVLGNRILIADAIQKSELKKDWDELVQYAHSGRGPRDRWEQGSPTMGGFDTKARAFQEKLIQVAREDMTSAQPHASIPLSPDVPQGAKAPKNSTKQSTIEVVHTISRTIDGETGVENFDEHRRVNVSHPKLFLEYSNSIAAQYAMTFSGLSLKNDGGRAFNIEFDPEIRAGLTLRMDNPTRSVDKGDEYAINLRVCENKNEILYPIGGMLSGQIQTLFERLADTGNDEGFGITIRCTDFDKRPFVSQSVLRWDIWTKRIWCERA